MFPPRQIDSNVIFYRIFFHPESLSDADNVSNIFSPKKSDLIRMSQNLVGNFIWHKHRFSLSLMTNSKSEHFKYFYSGKSDVGDAIQDEWLITFILWSITNQHSNVVVQLWDTDGDFLLIEAADYLPEWLTPEISRNRVFLKDGKLHLVQQNLASKTIALEDALNILFDSQCKSVASESIQEALMAKLGTVPQYIEENNHTTRCLIPKSIARILAVRPELIAPAFEAFYYREPSSASNVVSKMNVFSSVEIVESMVTMPRLMYAQLKHQEFFPPKPFANLRESLISDSWDKQAVIDLGIKIACGFELMYAEEERNQEGVKWREILDQIIQMNTEDFPNVLTEVDDESWLDVDPNTLDQKLMSKQRSTAAFNENGEELEKIASLFNGFIEKSSGVEGVQTMEPVSFDFNSFMELPNGVKENDEEDDDEDDEEDEKEAEVEHSEKVTEEKNDVVNGSQERISLHEVMDAMDAELAASHLGTFNSISDSKTQEFNCPESGIETGLNLIFNLLANLLESFASQEGRSGPFSNMLSEMGYVENSSNL